VSGAIQAFVGLNGGGKTLAAVERLAVPALRAGRPVVANFALFPDKIGCDPGLFVPLRSWRDLVRVEHAVVILDEITAALPSRASMSMPAQLQRVLNQLRKVDVVLAWTAPNWQRADVLLREVTQSVTVCRGFFPDRWVRAEDGVTAVRVGGKRLRTVGGWRPARLFSFQTYAAESFDEFTYNAVKTVRPVQRQWYRRKKHSAHLVYDTEQGVDLLDHLDDVGVCVICGGTRRRARCTCSDEQREAVRHEMPTVVSEIRTGPVSKLAREAVGDA